jgi:hypothetical protein
MSEWEGGEPVFAAWAEAMYGQDAGLSDAGEWTPDRLSCWYYDEDPIDAFLERTRPKRTPEEQAAADKAAVDELAAFEMSLFGPYAHLRAERNISGIPSRGSQWLGHGRSGKAKAPKKGRKSRKKALFWTKQE